MIFFFYVKFAFFGVIIKTPSGGQNCQEVEHYLLANFLTSSIGFLAP